MHKISGECGTILYGEVICCQLCDLSLLYSSKFSRMEMPKRVVVSDDRECCSPQVIAELFTHCPLES